MIGIERTNRQMMLPQVYRQVGTARCAIAVRVYNDLLLGPRTCCRGGGGTAPTVVGHIDHDLYALLFRVL